MVEDLVTLLSLLDNVVFHNVQGIPLEGAVSSITKGMLENSTSLLGKKDSISLSVLTF